MVSLQDRPPTKGKIMPPAPQIHGDIVNREIRILPDLSAIAKRAAQEYQQALRASFKLADGQFPRFDLVLLGMGNEGHTVSLFPGTKALHETKRIAVRNWIGKLYAERITLTAPAINHAAQVIFMVTGADKACALKGVLQGPYEPEQLPAQMIQPQSGKLLWLVDTAAGGMLSTGNR